MSATDQAVCVFSLSRALPAPAQTNGTQVAVACQRGDGVLRLVYRVITSPRGLVWPEAKAAPGFVSGLWQSTCFELFIAAAPHQGQATPYLEFNFSPSGDWALFAFTGYREPVNAAESNHDRWPRPPWRRLSLDEPTLAPLLARLAWSAEAGEVGEAGEAGEAMTLALVASADDLPLPWADLLRSTLPMVIQPTVVLAHCTPGNETAISLWATSHPLGRPDFHRADLWPLLV